MPHIKALSLSDLLVNPENYRFDGLASQKQAIEVMIENQRDKLYNLALHIVENGLNPNDKPQVAPISAEKGKYIVLEGNRRIVSIKLLNHPDLIDLEGFSALKKKFKKLHDDSRSRIPKEIECTVYSDPSEADKWIKVKHTGANNGVGTDAWTSQQVQRFEEKVEGRSSVALQAIKLLNSSHDVPSDIKSRLNSLKITNLDRLISDPSVRGFLGIDIQGGQLVSNVAKKEVIKGLTQVAKDLLDPRFNVKMIYTKKDRQSYLNKFSDPHIPNVILRASKPWQFSETHKKIIPKPTGNAHKERRTLIPKSCYLEVSNPKVANIYTELRKLAVEDYKNAVAVLFRVFVELSIDSYIEKNNISGSQSDNLQQKLFQVADHLVSLKKADETFCQGIKTSVKDQNSILGIKTWHGYVHNNKFSPLPSNLLLTWDNIQPFIEKVWAA